MRWDNLFSDLESQLEYGLNAEENDLHEEEERLRLGRLSLRDRLRQMVAVSDRGANYSIAFVLMGGTTVSARVKTIGKDWFAADVCPVAGAGQTQRLRQCIVPLAAVQGLSLTRRQIRHSLESHSPEARGAITDRLGLAFLLRDLCRRRTTVEVTLQTESLFGTIDRVGRDHFDLAMHEAASPRRDAEVVGYRLIAFDGVVMLTV
ncbi:hypothetical protein [Agreia bicolorata]|uniref:Uncharacterized protein n=1 Tax=Agreia bicolorata TaxID=110935 RepID=A0ABR5CEY5_9MICO|nr:hypothetical protein [Agreia bicolorata]KJC64169.1 hypothetical protein TZ00_11760 [Agreia bicolorata]